MKRNLLAPQVRARLKRLPPPFGAHYGVVPAPPPENGVAMTSALQRHQQATAALAAIDALAGRHDDAFLLSRILPRREAISSSAIEGTNSTLDELLAVEEDADTMREAARQVRDYALALEDWAPAAQKNGDRVFTLDLIRALHAEAMKGDPELAAEAGQWRDRVVWIGGSGDISTSSWNPPPPEDIEPCLEQTIDYLRNQGMQQMTQSLFARMAIAHAHFEAAPPFRDGNGRVGRMILPLMMAASGHVPLYLSPFIDAHKSDYYAALKDAQQRLDWAKLIGFFCDAVVATAQEMLNTRDALESLRQNWLSRRKFRKNSAALRALDLLPHFPVITARRLGEKLGVSPPQAQLAVDQLQNIGVLTERTGHARNRIFVAREALALFNRPFGGDAP